MNKNMLTESYLHKVLMEAIDENCAEEGKLGKFATGLAIGAAALGGCHDLAKNDAQMDKQYAAEQYAQQKVSALQQDREMSDDEYNDAIDMYYNEYMQNENKKRFEKIIKESIRKELKKY